MKKFSVGAAGRKNMSRGMDEYWIEVHDGKKAKGKKGFTWSAKKRKK